MGISPAKRMFRKSSNPSFFSQRRKQARVGEGRRLPPLVSSFFLRIWEEEEEEEGATLSPPCPERKRESAP